MDLVFARDGEGLGVDTQLVKKFPVLDGDGIRRLDVKLLGQVQWKLFRSLTFDHHPILLNNKLLQFLAVRNLGRIYFKIPEGDHEPHGFLGGLWAGVVKENLLLAVEHIFVVVDRKGPEDAVFPNMRIGCSHSGGGVHLEMKNFSHAVNTRFGHEWLIGASQNSPMDKGEVGLIEEIFRCAARCRFPKPRVSETNMETGVLGQRTIWYRGSWLFGHANPHHSVTFCRLVLRKAGPFGNGMLVGNRGNSCTLSFGIIFPTMVAAYESIVFDRSQRHGRAAVHAQIGKRGKFASYPAND